MFGTNPLRGQDLTDGLSLNIEQIFYTLQGEGPLVGTPAIFVRLSGCWLKCSFCDTEFEKGMRRKHDLKSIEKDVLDARPNPRCKLIVLTGGDPLRQNIVPLISRLADHGFHMQIETAGILWVPGLEQFIDKDAGASEMRPGRVSLVCSPKTGKVAKEVVQNATVWKYIIRSSDPIDQHDGLPNTSTQIEDKHCKLARPQADFPHDRIFLQPCDEYNKGRNDENHRLVAALCKRHGYRVSVQVHKLVHVE